MPICTRHELVAFCLATAVSLASIHQTGANSAASRLQIGVKHRPDVCTRRAQPGDEVSVHYKGSIDSEDSTVFRNTEGGEPFSFVLGEGEVIEGWEKGLMGMCVGERRKLKVPHTQGYKDIGNPALGIPGGANLVFEVEAASIEDGPEIIHLDADTMPVYSEPDTAFLEL